MDTIGRGSAVCNETCGCPVPCPGSVDCKSVNVHFLHSTNCAFCLLICGRKIYIKTITNFTIKSCEIFLYVLKLVQVSF